MGDQGWSAGWQEALLTVKGLVEFLDFLGGIAQVIGRVEGNEYLRSSIWHYCSGLLSQRELHDLLPSIERRVVRGAAAARQEVWSVEWEVGAWEAAFDPKLNTPSKGQKRIYQAEESGGREFESEESQLTGERRRLE